MSNSSSAIDVLVVGAGPTGLALAIQLQAFGARFRIIDKLHDRTRESRALGVQARTLELLQLFGLGEVLFARGNPDRRVEERRAGFKQRAKARLGHGLDERIRLRWRRFRRCWRCRSTRWTGSTYLTQKSGTT